MACGIRFARPDLDQLIAQIESDIAGNLPVTDTRLPGTPLYMLTRALGAGLHQLYGALTYIADQTNVLYASDENLDMWGTHWGIVRKQATLASGTVTVTGTNGTVIPAETDFRTADTGVGYITTESATIAGGSATLQLEAAEYGTVGNLEPGALLSLIEPLAGVEARATVIDMAGGSDLEGNTAYRQRILARIHQAPHGGAAADYITWAMETPGVTRAWCYPVENGPGTVVVRFMMDDSYDDGIPLLADVEAVADYIEQKRPVCADVSVYAPSAVPLDVTLTGLTPDNAETRAAVRAELNEMIKRSSTPGGTLYQSQFWDAISQATGVEHFSLTSPSGNATPATGQIHVLGTVTFA